MRAGSKRIAVLAVFVAVTVDAYAADHPIEEPATSMTAAIRAQFPYPTNSSLPAGESGQVDRKNPMGTATPSIANVQLTGNTLLQSKINREEPIVHLPAFDVNAKGYSNLEHQLDQIDKSISREQALSVPDKLDLVLNSGKILPRLISFGEETAEKRARDAYCRMQIFEMQRTVGLGLLYATPEDKKRLKDDQKFLRELSATQLDEEFTNHPWIR